MSEPKSQVGGTQEFDDLAQKLEDAISRTRKAIGDAPPLEELARLQQAMAGLSQMGALTEKMQAAAEMQRKVVGELLGEPNWRVEAQIEVNRGSSPVMRVELMAVFDLDRMVTASGARGDGEEDQAEIEEQAARGRGLALTRELNLLEWHVAGAPSDTLEAPELSPEANIPLNVNREGKLCFELAPALGVKGAARSVEWENGELPRFAPMMDQVCVSLDSFHSGEAFQRAFKIHQEELEVELKLAFLPL